MYINKQNNNDDIINEAGNTIFENIYKNCQNEIKDSIITNLLNKIKILNEKIVILEKQNKKLKDNLIYILKRILSNKNEYYYNYNSKYNKYMVKYTDSDSRIKESSFLETNYSKEKNKVNYSLLESPKNIRYNTELNNIYNTLNTLDSDNDRTKEALARKYLNNLYRKNFSGYTNGTPYSYFINKNKSIYEELFAKTSKNSSMFLNTFSNYSSPKSLDKAQRIMKSTDNKESFIFVDDSRNLLLGKKGNNKYICLFNQMKKLNIDLKKTNDNINKNKKVRNKVNSVDNKNKKKYIKHHRNASFLNDLYTEKTFVKKRQMNKLNYRSPYLINKF